MKARVKAEAVLFALFIIGGILLIIWPKFPIDRTSWWIVFVLFVVVFLFEICFVSPYRHAQKQEEEHRNELSSLRNERDNAVEQLNRQRSAEVTKVINEALKIIRENQIRFTPFALQNAGVGNLNTDEEFDVVCEALVQHNCTDPRALMSSPLMSSLTNHQISWLDLIRFANKKQIQLADPGATYNCIEDYLESKQLL